MYNKKITYEKQNGSIYTSSTGRRNTFMFNFLYKLSSSCKDAVISVSILPPLLFRPRR